MERLHPVDGSEGERHREEHDADAGDHAIAVGPFGRAVLVLSYGIFPQHEGETNPDGEVGHDADVEEGGIQHRRLGVQCVVLRLHGHPRIHALRKQGDGDEEHGQRSREAGDVFAITADRHRPTGVKKMVSQHEEHAAHAQAEEKHEGQQPRETKLFGQPDLAAGRDHRAEREEDESDDNGNNRHLAPARQIERGGGGWGGVVGSHTISTLLSMRQELHRRVQGDCVAGRGRRPRWPSDPRWAPASRSHTWWLCRG